MKERQIWLSFSLEVYPGSLEVMQECTRNFHKDETVFVLGYAIKILVPGIFSTCIECLTFPQANQLQGFLYLARNVNDFQSFYFLLRNILTEKLPQSFQDIDLG